jgi:hypothetical protein
LENQLQIWSEEFAAEGSSSSEPANDFSALLSLATPEKKLLKKYLIRIRDTADYKDKASRPNIVQRTKRMLQMASQNEEFRGALIALISEGLATCGDRVLIIFNDIEVISQLYRTNLTQEEAKKLAIRSERYELLKKHAKVKVQALGLVDEIETILYYCIKLRDKLDLPITTQGMLYPRMSGVTESMLKEAEEKIKSISDGDLLARSNFWQIWNIKKNRTRANEITEKYAEILEMTQEYYDKDPQERAAFLEQNANQTLAQELKRILEDRHITDYSTAAAGIDLARKSAIARISQLP